MPETPEARAALEARLRERANSIGDQSVRRHYMQAFDEKLAAFFAAGAADRATTPRSAATRWRGGRTARASGQRQRGTPRLVVSDTLRNSRLLKPGRAADATPREAVILMSLINHPALAESRLEALAELDFASPAARKLFAALLDIVTRDHDISARDAAMRRWARAGFGEAIERMEALLARQGVWQSGAGDRRTRRRNRPKACAGLALQVG